MVLLLSISICCAFIEYLYVVPLWVRTCTLRNIVFGEHGTEKEMLLENVLREAIGKERGCCGL